jgi:hypothetical protein
MARFDGNRERGGSKINFVLTILVLGAMLFAAIKIVPVYFANYQMQDAIETETRFALSGYPKRSVDEIRNEVWRKAQDLGIPVQEDAVQVNIGNGSVAIGLPYSIPIDLAVYQFTLEFNPHADNHSI